MIAVQTVWVEMGYVEEAMRQMKSQVFLIWREERNVIQKLEMGQKFLSPKNRINILHIALAVNVQFEKTFTAGSNMFMS